MGRERGEIERGRGERERDSEIAKSVTDIPGLHLTNTN